jgi:hypothetical protein
MSDPNRAPVKSSKVRLGSKFVAWYRLPNCVGPRTAATMTTRTRPLTLLTMVQKEPTAESTATRAAPVAVLPRDPLVTPVIERVDVVARAGPRRGPPKALHRRERPRLPPALAAGRPARRGRTGGQDLDGDDAPLQAPDLSISDAHLQRGDLLPQGGSFVLELTCFGLQTGAGNGHCGDLRRSLQDGGQSLVQRLDPRVEQLTLSLRRVQRRFLGCDGRPIAGHQRLSGG